MNHFEKNQENFVPIVLCAGFGTRFKPMTDYMPKVIFPVIDKPLAFFSIEKFLNEGFEKVYCNIHYMADMVKNELQSCAKDFGYDPNQIVFFNEFKILGSGGGILNIVQNLCSEDPNNKFKDVIVVSGDVVADFPITSMIKRWQQKKTNERALMLSLPSNQMRDDLLYISDDGSHVVGFGKTFLESSENKNYTPRLFSNHQIIASEMFKERDLKFESSIQMFYKKILDEQKKIIHDEYPKDSYWFNVGDVSEYEKCIRYFCKEKNLKFPVKNKMHFHHAELENQIKRFEENEWLQSFVSID